ncbi:MAG: xanthine dehydrogenase family protein molybdopterin-binding subunit [Chloroflexi bacterium]|nr:MAG: xanthine dehydrogenase family protein molybdopterin-binding subunit [Chloroflexota bacterium]
MTKGLIGQSIPRVDALDKVIGKTEYPGDLSMPGMLHMKVLFARRPHARIKRIDVSQALAHPGVVAVLTAGDVPVNEYGLMEPDQPALCGDVVRFVGDKVALIIGETPQAAAEGRDLVKVEYEDLPALTDPRRALDEDAPLVHAEKGTNLLASFRIRKGDIEAGFAQADVIVEAEYRTPYQEHAYLQPEAGLAYLDDQGRVVIETAGQWSHDDRHQIAHALNLPEDQVRVVYKYAGGAFGGREDMSVQLILALAAWKLRRPVKIVWSREESIIGHHKRHPYIIRARWGASRDGKLTAIQMDLLEDAGAYASSSRAVLNNAVVMATGPYECDNIHVDGRAVYTNNVPCGAFRGFGAVQAEFAAEMQMNKLAEKLGMDPVEFRMRNIYREGSIQATNAPVPEPVGAVRVLEAAARAAGWTKENGVWKRETAEELAMANPQSAIRDPRSAIGDPRPRGIGIACGYKNIGYSFGFDEKATVTLELHGKSEIEEVVVRAGASDVGQGVHTVLAQFVADQLEVPLDRLRLVTDDTAVAPEVGSCSASRLTFMLGNAAVRAAQQAKERWLETDDDPVIVTYEYHARKTTPLDEETGESDPCITYGYAAQAVEVEVDVETGQLHVVRVISAHDVGRAINPQQLQGQIEGGVAQGQGYATIENFIVENGEIVTPDLTTYLIPTVLDVPDETESLILEDPDPEGPLGARGIGEMAMLPIGPAIAAAVHDATGVWFDQLPLTPERVMWGLMSGRGSEGAGEHGS